jgi:hypothetical protein
MCNVRLRCPKYESGECLADLCDGFLQSPVQSGYDSTSRPLYNGVCRNCANWEHFKGLYPYSEPSNTSTQPRTQQCILSYIEQNNNGFTQHDRKILHQIQQVAVYGKNPTDSQRIGNIRREQVCYGVNRYKPASGRNKGYSASKAAMDAIRATEFKNKPGAYTDKEKRTLAQAILRAYNKK